MEETKEFNKKSFVIILFLLSLIFHLGLLMIIDLLLKDKSLDNSKQSDKSLLTTIPGYDQFQQTQDPGWADLQERKGIPISIQSQLDDAFENSITQDVNDVDQSISSQDENVEIDDNLVNQSKVIIDSKEEEVKLAEVEKEAILDKENKDEKTIGNEDKKNITIETITPSAQPIKKRRKIISDDPRPILKDFIKNFEYGSQLGSINGNSSYSYQENMTNGIKQESYRHRLFKEFVHAFRVLAYKTRVRTAKIGQVFNVSINIVVDKFGKIISFEHSTCGNKEVDLLVDEIQNYLNFPKIPNYLNMETYSYNFDFSIYVTHDLFNLW